MKTKKRSKILSLLLVLMMLLTMVPITAVTANAADDTSYTQAEIRGYKSFESYLCSYVSRDLKLMEDINYTVGIDDDSIYVLSNQKLDLNGHKITIDASKRAGFENLLCIRRGEFTLYDSKGGGELAVSFPSDDKAYSIIMMSSEKEDEPSKFTMNGGTLTKLSPNITHSYGASGCIGDDYFNKPENGKRSQITINGGTINCPYEWDRSKPLLSLPVEAMPLALQLLYSNLTINGGTFNGIVWTDNLWRGTQDTEPRVVLNGGEFNAPFVVEDMQKDATQIVIDGARFNDGFHVGQDGIYRILDVGTVPVLLLKSGVFTSPDNNPKLDIYNVTANSYGNGVNSDATARAKLEMILHAMKCFPNSAIKVNGKFYTSENIESLVGKNNDAFYLKLNSNTPIEVIRDAWGVMESVTLDGNPIDYAKDWNGTVERMDNSTAHTLKFEWYPLAQELKDAGYSYRTTCEHYISGSTAVQQTDTIAADKTSHTVTIPAGAEPKVYSFDLKLNLKKGDNNIGIYTNEHIVKLVVSEAPVVTEISSAPVRLSAALTPGTSAPGATAVGSGYTVDSINWYTDNSCTNSASTFAAGTKYYGKIVLKPAENYKFAASASAVPFCDDPNENYAVVGSSTVAEDGSSLTLVVFGTAVSALKWDSVDKTNQTYTIGDSALTLNAKAVGGDSSKPISYKLIAKKDGTETVKASAAVAASSTGGFSAPLRFTDTGSYECWFEATRGNVTITSDHFTVTVNAPDLSIANQSGDLTVKQNATARLFVKAVGHGVNYQWQVKNGDDWDKISGETAYDYAAPTTDVGEKTYRCKVTDKYGAFEYTNEMTVTVTEVPDSSLTPAILLAAINGDAPDPAELWPDKDVPASGWLGLKAEYNMTAGDIFHGVATFSTIPTGFNMNGHDIYYDSYNNVQKTPVLGTISYEWEGTTKKPWEATSGDFTSLGTDAHASFTIPSGVDTYYVVLSVKNTVGTETQTSTVYITFHVSAAHTHTYAYAQLNKDQHTKYCTAGDDSITENHTMENDVCKFCGYAPAKTYSVTVTNGSAAPYADVAPGTKVTLTANTAPAGQEFDKWAGNVTVASDNTFTMPSHNVTVAATYKPIAHTHTFDQEIIKDAALKTAADCTHDAVYYKSCSCGAISKTDTFTATGTALNHRTFHNENRINTPATTSAAGSYQVETICDICLQTIGTKTVSIPKIGTVSLSKEKLTYTGSGQVPTLTVKDADGNILKKDTDYTVSGLVKQTNVGRYKVTVTFKGKYKGTKDLYFTITKQAYSSKFKTTLSTTNYTYNGSAKKPSVTVYNSAGKKLVNGTDYTVSYASGRTKIGKYKVTVTFKGNYSGSKDLYFEIGPKNPSSVKTTLYGYDDVKVSWSKVSGASGYKVYYKKSSSSSWTLLKTTTATSYKKANLSDGVKYNFKVVAYKKVNGNACENAGKTSSIYTLKKVTGVKATKYSSKVKVSWTNISGETGYQISQSTSKSKTKIVATYKTTSGKYKTVSATKGKTYYYKVRAYKTVDGKKIYGPWSSVKAFKR